jgi:bacterioferritin-associated ferredoxin
LKLKSNFIIMFLDDMACTAHPIDDPLGPYAIGPRMTRCECAEISFEEAARRMASESLTVEELTRRTGCGGNCTACVPDLRRFLASR